MHVQRVLAWHLVINYPQSIFVAALFLLLNCRYTEILSESQVSKMQTRIQLSAPILVSPLPDTYVTAIQTTELTVRSMSGQRRDHARRTTRPAWRLAINYPKSMFIADSPTLHLGATSTAHSNLHYCRVTAERTVLRTTTASETPAVKRTTKNKTCGKRRLKEGMDSCGKLLLFLPFYLMSFHLSDTDLTTVKINK